MYKLTIACMTFLFAAGSSALGQKWEFGVVGGASIYKSQSVSSGGASGDVGFNSNFAVGAMIGNDVSNRFGGEVRYLYEKNGLRVNASGAATMSGESHAMHYDLLIYAAPRGAKVRPFVSVGAGAKQYRGTGTEVAYQPGSNLALLTQASEWKGLVTAGGGVKIAASKHLSLRAEFRTYLTPFPTKVIAPSRNVSFGGWIYNFVPLFGMAITY
jgi:opacity protein-like surface antigen